MKPGWITRKFIRVVSVPIALGWLLVAWAIQQTRPTFVLIGLGVLLSGLLPFLFISWAAKRSWWWFSNNNNRAKEGD